jgi:hypothetical protein
VDPANPVTFTQFFTGSTAHQSVNIRQIQADGTWATIPATTQIQRGEAYWIFCNGISSFQGQGSVTVDDRGLLDYGSTVVEHTVTLNNNTVSNAAFTLNVLNATPPPGVLTGGPVLLSLWRDGSNGSYGWERLTSSKSVTVLANTKKEVRLAIQRTDMAGQGADRPFGAVLQVVGLQTLTNIGVVADGYAAGGGAASITHAGLWVGQCILRNVNEPAGNTPNALQPTATEASLRLLLRVATDGSVSLVREATILWLDGLTDTEGNVTEAGRYLVAASDAELAQLQSTYGAVGTGRLKGATVRDGRSTPRRISSVGFSFTTPQALSGMFNPVAGTLTGNITVGYNDDLNPYKHRYHPDHDNLVDGSQAKNNPTLLPAGKESFTVNRLITLTFQASDPEDLRFPGWGDNVTGGTYTETISGLHRNPVKVAGTFLLSRVVAW